MEDTKEAAPPVILVVEDEALIRMGAADQLERDGYDVLEAGSAAEALGIIKKRPEVRVLFTDIDMPGEFDGMELAERVHRRWPKVLLLVTSGRSSLTDADVPDHGVFLSKPYGDEKLSAAVAELLRRQRSDRPDD